MISQASYGLWDGCSPPLKCSLWPECVYYWLMNYNKGTTAIQDVLRGEIEDCQEENLWKFGSDYFLCN